GETSIPCTVLAR
ncbi:hypothetical protein pipiens_000543, partial [Culex pipiens pipiens]